MGLSALAALVAMLLAYGGLSPSWLQRSRLLRDLMTGARVRSFAGYAVALLLLSLGFFLAGVPLGDGAVETAVIPTALPNLAEATADNEPPTAEVVAEVAESPSPTPVIVPTSSTPASGAFERPPTSTPNPDGEVVTETETPNTPEPTSTGTVTATPTPSNTPTPSPTSTPSPTPTASPTPTMTPSPTFTPTPIVGETAVVELNGSTVWVRVSPGGQNLVLLLAGDTVVLSDGRATLDGVTWREVRTVDGVRGWLPLEFLRVEE